MKPEASGKGHRDQTEPWWGASSAHTLAAFKSSRLRAPSCSKACSAQPHLLKMQML